MTTRVTDSPRYECYIRGCSNQRESYEHPTCFDHRSARLSLSAIAAAVYGAPRPDLGPPVREVEPETPSFAAIEAFSIEINGVMRAHRFDGPSSRTLFSSGKKIESETFHVRGLLHRLDGPAKTLRYDGFGTLRSRTSERYFVHGVEVADFDWVLDFLDAMSPNHLGIAFTESRFAPLLAEGVAPKAIRAALRGRVFSLEGIRELVNGAPVEWVRAYEQGADS